MSSEFFFRPLTQPDLPLLHEWLNRPHVAEWWEGPVTLEYVVSTYGADIDSPVVRPLLAYLRGEPIGFAQWYRVMDADPEWWTGETDPGARGIDQFLANPEQLGRGLGSQMVRELVRLLFADPEVTKVQTAPASHDARDGRAYENVAWRGRLGSTNTRWGRGPEKGNGACQ